MGCSASSHAAAVGAGLYIPDYYYGKDDGGDNDDDRGDRSWSPSSVVGSGEDELCGDGVLTSTSAACPRNPRHHRTRSHQEQGSEEGVGRCVDSLAPLTLSCQAAGAGASPERRPLVVRPRRDHRHGAGPNIPKMRSSDSVVLVAPSGGNSSSSSASSPTAAMQPLQQLNDTYIISACNGVGSSSLFVPSPEKRLPRNRRSPSPSSQAGDDEEVNLAFSGRRWLVLPERRYDMDSAHPPLPPYLGSTYWTAASPFPAEESERNGRRRRAAGSGGGGGAGAASRRPPTPPEVVGGRPRRPYWSCRDEAGGAMLSPSSTEEDEWEQENEVATSVSSACDEIDEQGDEGCSQDGNEIMNQYSPKRSPDISRELLDYSALDESHASHQAPRILFDDDDDTTVNNKYHLSCQVVTTPSRPSRHQKGTSQTKQKLQSLLCYAPLEAETSASAGVQTPREAIIPPAPSSPNVATFYGHWGSRRERHVSTLPSQNPGEPIRLRVTEKGGHHHHRPGSRSPCGISQSMSGHTHASSSSPGGLDFFSYDPYFSTGKYVITQPNGKPYGNGLIMRMGWQFMTLEDSRGAVLAVIKSRRTHMPSAVVYAPKARFAGQVASGHRLTRRGPEGGCGGGGKRGTAVVVDGGTAGTSTGGEALYPWALVSKGGRTMADVCSVYLVNDEVGGGGGGAARSSSLLGSAVGGGRARASSSSGIFNSTPSFRGRHGFDHELHTHTVVSRTTIGETDHTSGSSSKFASLEEGDDVPCCVIVRDPTNLDAVDITIAPGIDPLLMICYLASHSKMDVEPLISGY